MGERYEKPELIEFPILDEDMACSTVGEYPRFIGKKHCKSGGSAIAGCQSGGSAGWKCQTGTLARRDMCKSGGHAGKKCQAGSIPFRF